MRALHIITLAMVTSAASCSNEPVACCGPAQSCMDLTEEQMLSNACATIEPSARRVIECDPSCDSVPDNCFQLPTIAPYTCDDGQSADLYCCGM